MLCVEESIGVQDATPIPRQRTELPLESAVMYAEERHWDVFPGTWLEAAQGTETCSCKSADCPAPGAHPARPDWAAEATGSGSAARRLWELHPRASVLLPTGRAFDVLEVAESAGFLALARMERMHVTLGPVACTPDRRMLFFVLPGGAAKAGDLVRAAGWSPASLDLIARGEGHYVPAPPTRVGGMGAVQWARRPTRANRWLPDADEMISPLAYACGQEAPGA
ncbi:bifunctional DNA primase/polymerase [Streptomyces fuscigenes]|uniref:bifunctional DNA primase/polymerase n=1 Tax=Streptomyces fuscigenes TaxID=1528880 RepID=UPI001F20F60C|nr:bifunctional DNA primase/polymerase [Streptomyces fuscigenes]MCF3964927.1 bifunctional DNA primase/polymerase [Streptomyces fuscigenes]